MADESFDVSSTGRFRNSDIPDEDERKKSSVKKKRKGITKKEKLSKLSEDTDDKPLKKKRKSSKIIEDDKPIKKKKTSKSKEVALSESKTGKKKSKSSSSLDMPATGKQKSKLDAKKEKALANVDEIREPVRGDVYTERYLTMFDNIDKITASLEESMGKGTPSSRDVYALSTLYSQMREIINDIRSTNDVEAQMVALENEACDAFLKLVGQSFITALMSLRKEVATVVKDRDVRDQLNATMDFIFTERSKEVQDGYQVMRERIREVLA